jgi:hypothetical protein
MAYFVFCIAMLVFIYGFFKGIYWLFKDKAARQPQLKKAALLMIGSFIVGLVSAAMAPDEKKDAAATPAASKTEEVKAQQSAQSIQVNKRGAFLLWKKDYDAAVAMFDLAWVNWKGTMDRASKGKIDQQTAWSNMKRLDQDLELVKNAFITIKVPESLNDEAKMLNDATSSAAMACRKRSSAVKKVMEMIDNGSFRPSMIDSVMTEINEGDLFLIDAAKNVVTVERLVGAQAKKQNSKI